MRFVSSHYLVLAAFLGAGAATEWFSGGFLIRNDTKKEAEVSVRSTDITMGRNQVDRSCRRGKANRGPRSPDLDICGLARSATCEWSRSYLNANAPERMRRISGVPLGRQGRMRDPAQVCLETSTGQGVNMGKEPPRLAAEREVTLGKHLTSSCTRMRNGTCERQL